MKAGVGSGTPHIFKYLDGASPWVGSTFAFSAMATWGCLGSAHRGCLRASRDRCFRERVRNAFVRARASCPPSQSSCPVNLCELCGASTPSGVPPHKNSGEHVVWYLIINLDFNVGRLVAARRALLRTNIGRLPSHAQPRARDTADDVSPKSPSQMNVQKTGEPLVEPQPYR